MRKLLYVIAALVALAAAFKGVMLHLFFQRVPVATYGVQQHLFGDGGVVEADKLTGLHASFHPLYRWHLLDARMHVVHFVGRQDSHPQVSTNIRVRDTMHIRTKDNNIAYVDVSILYHIRPGAAYKIVQDGLQRAYQDRAQSTMEGVLRGELAQLSSEDYQDTEKRLDIQNAILPLLNDQLDAFYLEAVAVLIRRLQFRPEYESKLQDKQLQKQLSKLEEAKLGQFEEERVTKGLEQKITAEVKIARSEVERTLQELRSQNEIEVAQITAEKVLYQKQIEAEANRIFTEAQAKANLMLQLEEARRIEGRAAALGEPGGDYYNMMVAIKGLTFDRIVVNSNRDGAIDPLDFNQILSRFLPSNQSEK